MTKDREFDDRFTTAESEALCRFVYPEWPGLRNPRKPPEDLREFLRQYRGNLEVETMAKYVRADEMAAILEVDVRAVELLVANGMPTAARDKFDPNEAVPWYLAYMRTKIFGKAKTLGVTLR
jgi:hypothetical protein